MLSEQVIIKQLHGGNSVVFKEIFDMYYLPLRSFACHYVEDGEVTDDFVQDAFMAVWERRMNFDMLATIRSFLYTTVKNACLDYLKHCQVKQRNESQLVALFSAENEQGFVLEEEVHAKVYEAIKDLSGQSRRIVMMSMDGLSNPEIAERLSVSLNTVKTVKLRAYRTLRERLAGIQWALLFLLLA